MTHFVGYCWFLVGDSVGLNPCSQVSVYLFGFSWVYGWAAAFLACGLCVVSVPLAFSQ